MHELFHPDLQQSWEQRNRKALLAEGHSRLATPLYNIAFMAMALSAILGSGFSRLGYTRRIATIGAAAALVRIVGFVAQSASEANVWLNILQYAVPLGATRLRATQHLPPAGQPLHRHSPTAVSHRTGRQRRGPGMNSKLERYVLVRTLAGVGAALAVISAVILLVQFVDLSRTIGVRADVSAGDIFGLTLLKSPGLIQILLPFVFLFGTMSAFVGLNRRSELVAMRAAGISAWRFIRPAAFAAFVAGILAVSWRSIPCPPRSTRASRLTGRRSCPTIWATSPRTSGCARATNTPRW